MNYSTLARGIEVNEAHPAIVESQVPNSSTGKEVLAYMASTPKEVAKRFEEQAQVQREQFDKIRVQQESIDTLKQMLAQLLKKKKKGPKTKGKRREKALILRRLSVKSTQTPSPPNLHLRRMAQKADLITPER